MTWLFLPYHRPLAMRTFHILQNHLHHLLRSRRVLSWTTFSMARPVMSPISDNPIRIPIYSQLYPTQHVSFHAWSVYTSNFGSPRFPFGHG